MIALDDLCPVYSFRGSYGERATFHDVLSALVADPLDGFHAGPTSLHRRLTGIGVERHPER
jgi:hypothetical protein